jgi:hypothetical protein
MVDGKLERLKDIGSMITQWEELEDNDKEWVVEEGVRRGGRKISRRMSELIGIFGEKNTRIVGQTNGVAFVSDTTVNLNLSSKPDSVCSNSDISSLSSRKTENTQTSNINHIRSNALFMDKKTLSAGCDWPVGLTSIYLPTNEIIEGIKINYVCDGDGGGGGGKQRNCGRMGRPYCFRFSYNPENIVLSLVSNNLSNHLYCEPGFHRKTKYINIKYPLSKIS